MCIRFSSMQQTYWGRGLVVMVTFARSSPFPESLMSLKVTIVSNTTLHGEYLPATLVHWITLFARLHDQWSHLLQDSLGLQ